MPLEIPGGILRNKNQDFLITFFSPTPAEDYLNHVHIRSILAFQGPAIQLRKLVPIRGEGQARECNPGQRGYRLKQAHNLVMSRRKQGQLRSCYIKKKGVDGRLCLPSTRESVLLRSTSDVK